MKADWKRVIVTLALCAFSVSAMAQTLYTTPSSFDAAIAPYGSPTVIDFEDINADPVNNSHEGRTPFDGNYYLADGIAFMNPQGKMLFIAPGGLFWNQSNSLSIEHFPFEGGGDNDDDLYVTFTQAQVAVGFTVVDGQQPYTTIQFLDAEGAVIAETPPPDEYFAFRRFIGLISPDRPIAAINIIDIPNNEDDVNYDDFKFVAAQNTGVRIQGRITLEDIVNAVQTLTFVFRPMSMGAPFQRSVTLQSDGTYTLSGLPRQPYTLWVKGAKWLAETTPLNTTNGDVSGVNLTLRAGDADNSNTVNVFDLDALIQAFNTVPGFPNWNANADFNCDGSVDVFDLDLLIRNFNAAGDA
jgi:hypothetical protein